MPFDAVPRDDATLDLSRPMLSTLAHVLRHEELWPANHKWAFSYAFSETDITSNCSSGCALGIAYRLWGRDPTRRLIAPIIGPFGDSIFSAGTGAIEVYGVDHKHVTPAMVADKIDQYIAAHGDGVA